MFADVLIVDRDQQRINPFSKLIDARRICKIKLDRISDVVTDY